MQIELIKFECNLLLKDILCFFKERHFFNISQCSYQIKHETSFQFYSIITEANYTKINHFFGTIMLTPMGLSNITSIVTSQLDTLHKIFINRFSLTKFFFYFWRFPIHFCKKLENIRLMMKTCQIWYIEQKKKKKFLKKVFSFKWISVCWPLSIKNNWICIMQMRFLFK